VIDVSRVPVNFGGEGYRLTGDVDQLSVPGLKFGIFAAIAASVWQSEVEYGAAQVSVERRESHPAPAGCSLSSRGLVERAEGPRNRSGARP
jgi:hypothetical protein